MRLGGPLFDALGKSRGSFEDPDDWIRSLRSAGYRAAYCPVGVSAGSAVIASFRQAAAREGILISEVGAWSNPLSADPSTREAAMKTCIQALALADEAGARCAVNISGSRGEKWDGPCAQDLTDETFGMIVECVRKIIDAVKPKTACYTLETMPWMYPDSVESYLALLKAIDRKAFAVHFDPVNLVSSPQRYFGNAGLIRDFVEKLGPHIKSCHAKDILLEPRLTTKLGEVRPGLGALDYGVFLAEIHRLEADVPVMLEHLPTREEYALAAEHVRAVAAKQSIPL
jgi:sugar phosphate isomerase/epimerase